MISKSHYATDARVRREAEALRSAGHDLTVISLDPGPFDEVGVKVIGVGAVEGLRRPKPVRTRKWYRAIRWLLLPEHRQLANKQFHSRVEDAVLSSEVEPDVVHAHDFPVLTISSRIAERLSARLVYDSHEFWPGVQRVGRPDPIHQYRDRSMEGRLARRADLVITISEGSAALISDRYRIENVGVVRNTFPTNTSVGAPKQPIGAVYAGRISQGRDLQTVFSAPLWHSDSSLELHVMGYQDGTVDVPAFCHRHPESTLGEVDALLSKVGIALVTLSGGSLNHSVALPNKLFQAVSVGAPTVAADLPEISKVVQAHQLGRLYTPGDPTSLSRAVQSVIRTYEELRETVTKAQPALDWSIDANRLINYYRSLG
jgi:glycosyltransferase involved in cell wall biosynthesis